MSTPVENPQAGAGRPLPKKEADIFKNVVKHYEMKQYKKAIKQADSILKKFPNHGETLAMKGLTLNYMGKKEEAHALVKEGLRNDMRYAQQRAIGKAASYCAYKPRITFFHSPLLKLFTVLLALLQITRLLARLWLTPSFRSRLQRSH
jgi:tetratricopeptide (TPR) repeat protein